MGVQPRRRQAAGHFSPVSGHRLSGADVVCERGPRAGPGGVAYGRGLRTYAATARRGRGCKAVVSGSRGLAGAAHRLAERLELPKDVLFDLPRIVLIGNLQVSVENHRGLISYDGRTLALGLQSGRLVVRGRDLVVGFVGSSELTVTGRIEALEFGPGNGGGSGSGADQT